MAHQLHRDTPINIRALSSQRLLIDKAATLLNKSRSDFMLEVACREAENVLLDQRLYFADDKQYRSFLSLLELPVGKNKNLKTLLKSKSPWEK